jgi:hypothetical protein
VRIELPKNVTSTWTARLALKIADGTWSSR